jgi:hypothetical protein
MAQRPNPVSHILSKLQEHRSRLDIPDGFLDPIDSSQFQASGVTRFRFGHTRCDFLINHQIKVRPQFVIQFSFNTVPAKYVSQQACNERHSVFPSR